MTAITTLGVDNLSLRGAGTEYNLCTRLFTTKAEADAALAGNLLLAKLTSVLLQIKAVLSTTLVLLLLLYLTLPLVHM